MCRFNFKKNNDSYDAYFYAFKMHDFLGFFLVYYVCMPTSLAGLFPTF